MSDSAIAEHVGVSHATVIKYRAELESTCQIDKSTSRKGKDGRTINTANIGKSKSSEPEPVEEESEPEEEFCPDRDGPLSVCGCDEEPEAAEPNVSKAGKPKGVGLFRAGEAIGLLKKIPKNDCFRLRGFEKVSDFIKQNT